jgi:hypothetical protein
MTAKGLMAAAIVLTITATSAARAEAVVRPRMLLAQTDPFSGIPALKARYAAGARPSDDALGWALTYVLTGDESFARRALADMQGKVLPTGKSSSLYIDYMRRALEFDWLYGCACFDAALKDRVAAELVDGAARMLALQSLADPAQASYHNHTARELALAVFSLTAVEGHPSVEPRAAPPARPGPQGARQHPGDDGPRGPGRRLSRVHGLHADHLRALALMAELRRTTTGEDPARRFGVFRNMGPTYLYKVLPDGSTARDDDNEFPHLDDLDNVVLAYAVHRFKDPYAAWILRRAAGCPRNGGSRSWSSSGPTIPSRLGTRRPPPRPSCRASVCSPGIGHLILRDGWGPDSTWVEFTCGPYFAKHDHLDTNHFVIYHRGNLALDTGADYTDTESPHYLGYYRRTVAHNTMLVYKPGETFFWGENLWTAVNDGGQRMDSSRFWNSVRSLEDWRRTRDLWDRGQMVAYDDSRRAVSRTPPGDGTRGLSPSKVDLFVRDLLWLPRARGAVRARSASAAPTSPIARRELAPRRERAAGGRRGSGGGPSARPARFHRDASVVTFADGQWPPARAHAAAGRRRSSAGRTGVQFLDAGRREGRGRGDRARTGRSTRPRGGPLPRTRT